MGVVAGRDALNPTEIQVLEHLLDEAFASLIAGDAEHLRAVVHEAADLAGDDAEVVYLQGQIAWHEDGPKAARPFLERAVQTDPDFADAHHALGLVLEVLGDKDTMVAHNLEVLRLDTKIDAHGAIGTPEDLELIEAEAERVLHHLPERFRDRLENVPVVLEPRPSRAIVAEGFDPRALGMFEGAGDRDKQAGEVETAPTRVVLFFANLLASFPDDEDLALQVEVTILHELAHFFGLDEDEVAGLGLE
jgi:predicted Zn-dependent protease with MMP-like domain